MHECNNCTTLISHSETLCQECLTAIESATPPELKDFIAYVLECSEPTYTSVNAGYTLFDDCASGKIRAYKKLLKDFSVVYNQPYEIECGYYDSLIFTHTSLNSRVELSEDPQMGISIRAYINCAKGHPDLLARQCPSCEKEYSQDNPFSSLYNVCSSCAENIEIDREADEEIVNQIDKIANSDTTFDEKRVWTADIGFPWPSLSVPPSFKDITFPKYRLNCGGMHSRGLLLCAERRILFVDVQSDGNSTLIALPEPPVFNDPTFHTYVDDQLQYVPVDLHALVKLITKSGRRYAESVLNQPSQLEITMTPKELTVEAVKVVIPASLMAVPNEDDCLEWRNETGLLSLVIGLSNDQNDQVEYASLVLRRDEATTSKLSALFAEAPSHCVDCGVELVLGKCLECEEHNPTLRPDHNDFLNELPEYIVVWLESVARHHMLAGVQNQGGVLSVVAYRDCMTDSAEDSSQSVMVCTDYVKAHFFCLESTDAEDSVFEKNGVYLSPDGKVLVEIHPSNISILVYPNSIPAWC